MDLFDSEKKAENERFTIKSFEEWVMCFNTYIAIMAKRQPDRVQDLLAYSSSIVKASQDYVGKPWLACNKQLRKRAAADCNKV